MESADAHAHAQYGSTTRNLDTRVSIYDYRRGEDWYEWMRRRLPLISGQPVLDVGAGTGLLWANDHGRRCRPVVTDAFWPMCLRLKAVPNAAVLRCAAGAIPFRDAAFEGVIATHVLYHLRDPDAGVRELARVCRPGGWVAVTTNTTRHLAELVELARDCGLPPFGQRPHLRFDAVDAERAVTEVLGAVTVHAYDADLEVPTPDPVLAYVSTLEPGLDEDAQRVVRERIASVIDAEGAFHLRSSSVLIVASTAC